MGFDDDGSNGRLVGSFKNVLKLEEAAERMYGEHIDEFEDFEIRRGLEHIREEKERHVLLADRMVTILEERLKRRGLAKAVEKGRYAHTCPSCGEWHMSQAIECRRCRETGPL